MKAVHVSLQQIAVAERLLTKRADVLLAARVCHQVASQVGRGGEPLAAVLTLIAVEAAVQSLVLPQAARRRERLLARAAKIRLPLTAPRHRLTADRTRLLADGTRLMVRLLGLQHNSQDCSLSLPSPSTVHMHLVKPSRSTVHTVKCTLLCPPTIPHLS